jgi:PAS domain S-box-containing protein
MRESEALYRTLIERSPEAIAVHRDGKYIYFNPTADKLLGATPENNLVGKPVLDLVHPDSREFVLARIAALAKEGSSTPMAEMKLVRLDGTAIDVEAQGTQICHKGVPTTYVLWRDITARKQAEATNAALQAQLLEARKMEALGTLAGGIAHDFNNILASIRGSVQLARTELRAPPVVSKSLNQIETSAARALELVRQILAFSRGQKNVRTAQDMTIAVDEAVEILRAALPSTIDIQTRLESNLPFVETSLVAVHQLVMNLGVNAAHAMADAGRLDIEVDAVDVDSALAGKVHKLESRSAVRLTVRDSGSGMDSGTKTRAFEPFFSTKGPDAGTGLGLSVVYGIVKEHGAEIDIDSAPGKGTTFRIYFSAVARETQPGGMPADSSAAPILGQGERLLFVDDEDELVALSQTLLEKMGYQVRTCHDGEEALDAFARDPDAFDAMITDITMPGMSGLDLAQKIREIRADFPVIVMSGHVRDADAQRAGALGLGEIHWKPNTVSDLADTLRERLRRAKP